MGHWGPDLELGIWGLSDHSQPHTLAHLQSPAETGLPIPWLPAGTTGASRTTATKAPARTEANLNSAVRMGTETQDS